MEKHRLFKLLDNYSEKNRIMKEGPTLKNVADNLRTIGALIGSWVLLILFYRQNMNELAVKIGAFSWSVWLAFYSFLAVRQASELFLLFLADVLSIKFKDENKIFELLLIILAFMVLFFGFSAIFIIVNGVQRALSNNL